MAKYPPPTKEIHYLLRLAIQGGVKDRYVHEAYERTKPPPKSVPTPENVEAFKRLLPKCFEHMEYSKDRFGLLIGSSWYDSDRDRMYFRMNRLVSFYIANGWPKMTPYIAMQYVRQLGGENQRANIDRVGINITWLPFDMI